MLLLTDLVEEVPIKLQQFDFVERVQKVRSLLTAQGILPSKRAIQHSQLHNTWAGLFVLVNDQGGSFQHDHSSGYYNTARGLPSNTYDMLNMMAARKLLDQMKPNQWAITDTFKHAVGPLTEVEVINA